MSFIQYSKLVWRVKFIIFCRIINSLNQIKTIIYEITGVFIAGIFADIN